jgi:hypothetical protein
LVDSVILMYVTFTFKYGVPNALAGNWHH